MRVLVVKLTSMGDVLHVLPALTDLRAQYPDVIVDWMVEDSFAEIPAWHSSVDQVITVASRRWRKLNRASVVEFVAFWKQLRAARYDVVIDAQGLIKSAVFARFARLAPGGTRAGFSGTSIKESPAARLYKKRIEVARQQHAIDRLRQLFAGVFDYPLPQTGPDYDPQVSIQVRAPDEQNSVMLLHGTTWPSKHLPESTWVALAELAHRDGYRVKVCWGDAVEKQRAEWLGNDRSYVDVLPKSNLNELAAELRTAAGVIAVDTGLGHLAAALGVPCVSIYGATDATLTGAMGKHQIRLQSAYPCSPCLLKTCPKLTEQITEPPCYSADQPSSSLQPTNVWQALRRQIG